MGRRTPPGCRVGEWWMVGGIGEPAPTPPRSCGPPTPRVVPQCNKPCRVREPPPGSRKLVSNKVWTYAEVGCHFSPACQHQPPQPSRLPHHPQRRIPPALCGSQGASGARLGQKLHHVVAVPAKTAQVGRAGVRPGAAIEDVVDVEVFGPHPTHTTTPPIPLQSRGPQLPPPLRPQKHFPILGGGGGGGEGGGRVTIGEWRGGEWWSNGHVVGWLDVERGAGA